MQGVWEAFVNDINYGPRWTRHLCALDVPLHARPFSVLRIEGDVPATLASSADVRLGVVASIDAPPCVALSTGQPTPLALVREEPVNLDAIALAQAHLRIDALEMEVRRIGRALKDLAYREAI